MLDGQVRKIGKTIRIGLTLSETEAGSVVWSDKITRPFEDLLDVLDETVSKIAATVAGRMEDASIVAARRRPPDNIEAFECLLRGIDHHRLGGVTDDNAREAVKWFTKAIEADPNYAAAYAWRVCAASWLPEFDIGAGERDIRRALELDPCDPEANRILGFIELLKSNFDQAKSLSLKAMEMNPTDAYIRARSAAVMTYVGEPLRSLSLLDEAEALDPLLPVWCIEERGVALYALERYREALEAFGRLVFQTYRSRLYGAAALIALDRPDEARKLAEEAIAGNPSLTTTSFMTKEWYRDLEKRQSCRSAWRRPDCQNSFGKRITDVRRSARGTVTVPIWASSRFGKKIGSASAREVVIWGFDFCPNTLSKLANPVSVLPAGPSPEPRIRARTLIHAGEEPVRPGLV